ncbi:SpoIIE family protein phosphatase [Azospirillum agricola]|uniref:SpoIIE family protein phosphatase n=1 Tax=Azospirillum agricola TaxID=1720247 RepID=UPI000A0EF1CD|nr:SpoIIE family protein phosphatase [Azospirillum agricola]SMH59424.1 HAMP domain-containing protein [Azospirillum lipoferum]
MSDSFHKASVWRGGSLLARVGVVILVTTVTVGVVAVGLSERIIEGQRHQDLLRRAELVAATQADALSGPVWELDDRAAQVMIDALLARDPAIRAIAVHEINREAPLARADAAPRAGSDDGAERVTVDRPIILRNREGRTETVGHLTVVYSAAEVVQATIDALVPVVGLLLLSLLGAVAVLGITLNRIVLGPLRRLTQLSRAMARGDYGARMATDRADEIGLLADSFNRMAETVQDHTRTLESRVEERTEALAATNRAIMDSINYAHLIQSSILPNADTLAAALTEHFVLWRPRDVVSGDFYLCRAVADGFVVAVADCTGHGVPGAFMTMTASAMLDNALDQMGGRDPAAVLSVVDRKVRAALHQDGLARSLAEQFDNGLDLALCHVDPARRRLTFAGARIPLLIVTAEGVGELRGDRHSLGYRREAGAPEVRFTNHGMALLPGQTFCLGTDGLTDQDGGERGRSFGRKRLREALERMGGQPLDQLRAELEHSLDRHQAGRSQRDDITLFGFRPRLSGGTRHSADSGARHAA